MPAAAVSVSTAPLARTHADQRGLQRDPSFPSISIFLSEDVESVGCSHWCCPRLLSPAARDFVPLSCLLMWRGANSDISLPVGHHWDGAKFPVLSDPRAHMGFPYSPSTLSNGRDAQPPPPRPSSLGRSKLLVLTHTNTHTQLLRIEADKLESSSNSESLLSQLLSLS